MDHVVLVRVEKVFGRLLFYPENEIARKLADLAHAKKALSESEINIIKALGYTVEAIAPKV